MGADAVIRAALCSKLTKWVIYAETIQAGFAISLPYGFAVKRGVSKEGRIERGIKLALIPNDSPIFGGRRFLRGPAVGVS